MKKILVALISVLLLCTMFAGCNAGINDTEDTFTIYAEAGYLDKAEIETGFTEYYKAQTGLDIKTEVLFYDDTDKMLKNVRDGKITCDLILAKDYAAQALINENKVQGIVDEAGIKDEIPNFANISEWIISAINDEIEYNKDNLNKTYSIPFSFRTQGVLYNKKNVPSSAMGSLYIFANEVYKGQVALDNDYRSLYTLGSIYVNYSDISEAENYQNALSKAINNFDYTNKENVKTTLKALKKLTSSVYADNSTELLLNGKKDIALCWSNEAVKAIEKNDNKNIKLYFKIAEQGGAFESNLFVMPNKANNKQEAKKFLNYILSDEVAISQMKYSGNTSVIATNKLVDEFADDAVEANNYSYFFGAGNNSKSLQNGYYPTFDEINTLALLKDMGESKEDISGMVNSLVSNTLLIVLVVVIGTIIVGVAIFLIFFVTKKSKQNTEKKERMENSKGFRKE